MTIKDVSNVLRVQMYSSLAAAVLIIVLFETETVLPGVIEKGSETEFLLQIFMEIVTICIVPVALRLFKFGFVKRAIAVSPVSGLQRWGVVRMAMLCDTMIVNTLLYYITPLNVAFGYMAIICLICLVFVNPTLKRCNAEVGVNATTGE